MSLEIRPGVQRLFHLRRRGPDAARDDMDEELRFHLDARIEQLVARGWSPDAARAEALRRLGGAPGAIRQRLGRSAEHKERTMKIRELIQELISDLRYAWRGLLRQPGFTTTAVLTLAVGIGGNIAVFSAVNALLLRPLPFPEPGRLMDIVLTAPPDQDGPGPSEAPWSFLKFAFFRDAQTSFSSLALHTDQKFNLSGAGGAERIDGETVSARYLSVLGISPALGRDFPVEEDAHGGAPRLLIVSDALWKRRFGANPAVLDRVVTVDGEPFQVIAVLPSGFRGLSGRADILLPITSRSAEELAQSAWSLEFGLIGRLRPGVTTEQATSEVRLLGPRVYQAYPMERAAIGKDARSGWSADSRPLDATRVAPAIRRSLLILLGAVGCVLLIACVNLASLLLGRSAARRQEIAIRLAIGAGRGRLVRLLLAESTLLAFVGGGASLFVAWGGTSVLNALNPEDALRVQGIAGLGMVGFDTIRLDAAALTLTLLLALAVGFLFGLAPALQATRFRLADSLKSQGMSSGMGAGARLGLTRRTLVITEVALALVLLAGAGLMVRSVRHLLAVDPGFDPRGLLTLRLALDGSPRGRDSLPAFYQLLQQRLGAVPGVADVALADCPPLSGGCNATQITFPDRPPVPATGTPAIGVHFVSPNWFDVMRIPVTKGRGFSSADQLGAEKVILISQLAAQRFWPNQDPIGQRAAIWQGGFHVGARVIGVVPDVRFATVDSLPRPDAYISYQQSPRPYMMIFVKTRGEPMAIAPAVRRALQDISPDYAAYDVQTMEARVAAASSHARFSATLLGLFALVALALAVMGIYGVMSFAVLQRTREIGIRMALGADRKRIFTLVVREGLALALAGGAIGLAAALAITRVLSSLLYEVRPSDPSTYSVIAALLVLATLLATWAPAQRAARIDPIDSIRQG